MFSKNPIVNFQRELNISYQKSFTLIELLVVIAVIGLLATIVLVAMEGARERAREARMSETLRQIELAAHLDYQEHENWSPDVGPNQCDPCAPGVNRPRFVKDGLFPVGAWDDTTWYHPQSCFDWQNWEGGNWISIDVYRCRPDGTCCDVVKRRCIYDAPGGGVCTSF